MKKYQWSKLNHLQIGQYAEYLVKMELIAFGLDVYSAEVDDKGIDFILRKDDLHYYDVQVKSARNLSYIFFPKSKFLLRSNMLAAVVLFEDDRPASLYLIPSVVWQNPTNLFASKDYEGKQSPPEWGLNLSRKNIAELEQYQFENMVDKL